MKPVESNTGLRTRKTVPVPRPHKGLVMNESSFNFNLSSLTRQQRFEMWKSLSKKTYCGLAKKMGVSHVAVRNFCLSESAPPERVEQLRLLGVPQDLLPTPRT